MKYLASCSIVKNEDNYIDEFIEIHKYLGVEHFLFFDRSDNPLSERYKEVPDITVINFPEPKRHADAWMEGAKYFDGKFRWVQFIDIDQVTVPVKHQSIPEMLKEYEEFDALSLNWHTFGSSYFKSEPSNTYSNFIYRAQKFSPINNHVQTIANPSKIVKRKWDDPHHPPMINNSFQVNENKKRIKGPFNIPPSQDIGFIAHYYTRSEEYWKLKCAKMRADTGTPGAQESDFNSYNSNLNDFKDDTVAKIWKKTKKNNRQNI